MDSLAVKIGDLARSRCYSVSVTFHLMSVLAPIATMYLPILGNAKQDFFYIILVNKEASDLGELNAFARENVYMRSRIKTPYIQISITMSNTG